jgi:hypothetical protein
MRLLQYVSMRQAGDVGGTRQIGVCRMRRRSSKSRRSPSGLRFFYSRVEAAKWVL